MKLTKVKMGKARKIGLGDIVERVAHPFAVALRLPCLDKQTGEPMPESPCGKRRDRLNKIGDKVVDNIKKLIPALALLWAAGASGQTNTNWVYIPFGHSDVVTNWWTNTPPPTAVSNWQAWQAANYNFLRLWNYWSNSTPRLAGTNTWTGPQKFMSTVEVLGALSGDGTGLTNINATNTLQRALWPTNSVNGEVVDATLAIQMFETNESFNISGFSGLQQGVAATPAMRILNTGATNIVVGGAPTTYYIGQVSTNSMTITNGKRGFWSWWIVRDVETNCANAVQQ